MRVGDAVLAIALLGTAAPDELVGHPVVSLHSPVNADRGGEYMCAAVDSDYRRILAFGLDH